MKDVDVYVSTPVISIWRSFHLNTLEIGHMYECLCLCTGCWKSQNESRKYRNNWDRINAHFSPNKLDSQPRHHDQEKKRCPVDIGY